MIRGMNKKGESEQSSISGFVIAGILILILVGVIIAFWGPINSYLKSFNDDTQKTVNTCTIFAKGAQEASYCKYNSVELGAKAEYINCIDSRITNKLDAENRERYLCDSNPDYKKEVCKTLILTGVNTPVLNGKSTNCLNVTENGGLNCAYLNGIVLTDIAAKCGSDKPKLVNITDAATSERCCIALV